MELHELVSSIIGRYVTIDYLNAEEGRETATLTLKLSDYQPLDVTVHQYNVTGEYHITVQNASTVSPIPDDTP